MLANEIRCQLSGKSFDKDALEIRLVDNLVGTMNFDDNWTDHYKTPFKALIKLLV
jgi:hypothetical protein